MLTLHQFPISHYCEKVRWALDYKGLEYRINNYLPGLHSRTANRLAATSSLPILVHDGKAVQNSSTIITYLDGNFRQRSLTPEDEALKQAALDWENFVDDQIGIAVRKVCYHVLLDNPAILVPLMAAKGPWYGPYLLKAVFPKLRAIMRNGMDINAKTASIANQQLTDALEKVDGQLQNRPFLVGEQFTRADLATASLLAPLCKLKQFGLTWPERFPEPLEAIIAQHSAKLAWVDKVYAAFR
jgi:glutathione S-transferase